ncbi:MAG: sigma 54-interacting transcriptional regulator [Deltaproteobacteria bacterium]|nr:sigma 54-interacting transcriptional regulator [Deltaproteobacteria bacterium]MBI2540435.1 sigma 54-interacting transcriptional regulator [Deltaproteobacteria bacterium]MBI2992293.1 sigma 54-interacting transcriptional regulator [Deltaproteobacteria bacterium]
MNDRGFSGREANYLSRQYRTLLEVSESIVSHRDLTELFRDLAPRLHGVIDFDFINLILHESDRNVMVSNVLETPDPNYACPSGECPMETPGGWVWQTQQPWVVSAMEKDTRFPDVTRWLTDRGIKSLCVVPTTTALRRLGALAFGSSREGAYSQPDVEFLQQVAKQVALAVDNALNFERAQSIQQQLKEERDRLSLLLEVNNAVVSTLDLHELLNEVSASLRRLIRHEYASLSLYDPETQRLQIHALDFPASRGLLQEGLWVPVEGTPTGLALTSRQPIFLTRHDIEQFGSDIVRRILGEGLKAGCCLPLISHGRPLGTLVVASLTEETFPQKDAELLQHVANQIAIAVENALAFGQVVDRANKLTEEKLYLQDEIRTEYNFEEIIGESPALKRVLQQVQTVAPTDSTILIQGETGTGKELIARAIHNLSGRRDRTLVKVNCAAIPTGLLESELFGHEKGAFTGAIAQRIGRFELANGGTLFLDEVGDIPLELQPKLLRVLQEQEFERLGSTRTIRVNVRLVAATNSDLTQMVADKQFRRDLYYRLNVFPVTIPPLRERREDIPLLVRYFVQQYARRMKKRVDTIPAKAMSALSEYRWPGNVRELENFIERAVILSPGPELRVPLAELKTATEPAPHSTNTLEEAEREHILKVLKDTDWVVGGPSGAAARLGIKRTTLQSRIKKLGITHPR